MTREDVTNRAVEYCAKCTTYEDMTSMPIKRKHLIDFAMSLIAEADDATRKEFDVQMHPNLSDHIVARLKLILIASVLRGDWKPDFENRNQQKWYPWFEYLAGSGFDFSNSDYDYGIAATTVGSRLCFPTKELSDYFGKQFIELHREHLS